MAKNKSALGRGLGALLGSAVIDQPVDQSSLTNDDGASVNVTSLVSIAKIQANPFQPRRDFDPDKLQELSNSIKRSGVMTAISLRRMGEGFQLISGERRVRASIEAGLTEIPALILDIKSDREMMELSLIENIQREDLNPIEIAHSYQQLLTLYEMTQEELAESVGKDRSTVTNFIRLLKLPEQVQQSLRHNEIAMGHARALLAVPDDAGRLELWRIVVDEGLSVRRTEALARVQGSASKTPSTSRRSNDTPARKGRSDAATPKADAASAQASERLQHVLGTQVRIKGQAGGAGSIVIDYYSADDLERLIELFGVIEEHNR
ncbi:MAG: ParB/RepB/Spo0J family partition protein [bacterium]|nr:ParB/RepB/Spo0J family partition protein [Candidatus Kapabacteria bacterium]